MPTIRTGEVTQAATPDGTINYSYDADGQLTQAASGNSLLNESYSYDANGNTQYTGVANSGVGADNQLASDGTYTYQYDPDGNCVERTCISSGVATGYTWDNRDRLTAVTTYASYADYEAAQAGGTVTPTQVVQYTYDVENRWIGEQVYAGAVSDGNLVSNRQFVYDGNQIVLQFDKATSGAATVSDLSHRYLWGPAVDQLLADEQLLPSTPGPGYNLSTPGTTVWALTNNQGSVVDLATYASGVTTIATHRVYNSYGNLLSQTPNPAAVDCLFGYTGRPFDTETGLQNNDNRWYEPITHRWLSPDPAAADVNLYRYCGNGPTNGTDPSGLDSMGLDMIGGGVAGDPAGERSQFSSTLLGDYSLNSGGFTGPGYGFGRDCPSTEDLLREAMEGLMRETTEDLTREIDAASRFGDSCFAEPSPAPEPARQSATVPMCLSAPNENGETFVVNPQTQQCTWQRAKHSMMELDGDIYFPSPVRQTVAAFGQAGADIGNGVTNLGFHLDNAAIFLANGGIDTINTITQMSNYGQAILPGPISYCAVPQWSRGLVDPNEPEWVRSVYTTGTEVTLGSLLGEVGGGSRAAAEGSYEASLPSSLSLDSTPGAFAPSESPDIAPGELTGQTRDGIRQMADDKGLIPKGQPDPTDGLPRKWSDPVTNEPRLRLDRGHIDPDTGLPYDNPNAAVDHVHGYEPDGTPIRDPSTGDKHFPTE